MCLTLTVFSETMIGDEHWNWFKGNIGETPERWDGAQYRSVSEYIDNILNSAELSISHFRLGSCYTHSPWTRNYLMTVSQSVCVCVCVCARACVCAFVIVSVSVLKCDAHA